jgi:hypothetical protein
MNTKRFDMSLELELLSSTFLLSLLPLPVTSFQVFYKTENTSKFVTSKLTINSHNLYLMQKGATLKSFQNSSWVPQPPFLWLK